MKSSDFERPRPEGAPKTGWWGWKLEKHWLEAWFALGKLMIARRENFQRVYDLTERVLQSPPAELPGVETMRRAFIIKAVEALGITRARWISDYFRLGPRIKDADLDPLVASGDLLRARVEGWPSPAYVHPSHADLARQAEDLRPTHTTLLSPFDPVVWDRERAAGMFQFDYRLECYVPEGKRQYGYYVLPILRKGRLIGRLDAKAHRAHGWFEVKSIYLEPGVRPTDALTRDVARALQSCADWHETPQVKIRRSDPRGFSKSLRAILKEGT